MPAVTYVSRTRIAPGHMPGVQYSIAFLLKDYEPGTDFEGEEHKPISGPSQFVHLRDDAEWQITTEPMTGAAFDVFYEFLNSVGDGQEFTWDFYASSLNADGTPVAVRPVTVQLVDRSVKPKRWKKPGYFEFSFKVRQADAPLLAENFYFDLDLTKASAEIMTALGIVYSRTGTMYALRDDGKYYPFAADNMPSHYDCVLGREMGCWFGPSFNNVLLWSSDFSNAVWSANTCTKAAATSIISGGTAQKLTNTGTNGQVTQSIGTFTAGAELIEAHFEQGNNPDGYLGIYDVTAGAFVHQLSINYSTGGVTSTAGTGTSVTARAYKTHAVGPNGGPVWRLAITYTAPTAGNSRRVYLKPQGNSAASGQFGYVHHCQLQAGTTITQLMSPPIVTTTATVVRGADVLSQTDLAAYLANATEITLGAVFDLVDSLPLSYSGRFIELNDNTANERHLLYRTGTNVAGLTTDAASTQATLARTVAATGRHRAAYSAKANRFALSENGAAPALDTAGAMPIISQLHIGQAGAGASSATCYLSRVLIDARAYSDAELQGWAA